MFVDIIWTLPISEEQWLRPEDVQLAEVCVSTCRPENKMAAYSFDCLTSDFKFSQQ